MQPSGDSGVRAGMVPHEAFVAWQCLTERQQHVLRSRCAGESCAAIGQRLGVSKQAVSLIESSALTRLSTLAGRPFTPRCGDLARSCRADYSDRDAPELAHAAPQGKGRPRWARLQTRMDSLVDEWLDGRKYNVVRRVAKLEAQLQA